MIQNLEKIFKTTEFKIIEDYDEVEAKKSFKISTLDDALCLELFIDEEGIYLNNLFKCGINNGTKILSKLDEFANISNLKIITINEDDSHIDICGVRINLSYLNILENGKSWFNAHGYYSSQYYVEFDYNKQILEKDIEQYIRECIHKNCEQYEHQLSSSAAKIKLDMYKKGQLDTYTINKATNERVKVPISLENQELYRDIELYNSNNNENKIVVMRNYKTRLESYLPRIKEIFRTYFTGTNYKVKDFFIVIKKILREINTNCNDKDSIKIIANQIDLCSLLIKYEKNFLTKIVSNIENCLQNLKIKEPEKTKICKSINGITDKDVNINEKQSNFNVLIDLIFNNYILTEELLKSVKTKDLCFCNNIYCEIDNVNKFKFYIWSHVGKSSETKIGFNSMLYYNNEIKQCDSNIIAIPFSFFFIGDDSSHANMLIIDRTDNQHIVVEHFEPHGKLYLRNEVKQNTINNAVENLIIDIFTNSPNGSPDIKFLHPEELCQLSKESNKVLQSFTSDSNKWSGSCSFFSLWYAFKRLLEPDKNSRQIYLEINTFLKINKNNIDNFMQEIISTFFSFLNIDLDNFTLKQRKIDKVFLLIGGIEHKNLDAINFILSKEKDYDKLLIETLYYNNTAPIVELLLERGANINSKDNTYSTALMIASHENNSNVVRVLIDHGANINQKNIFGKTALDYASDNNYTEIIDLLLQNGAKPKVTWWDWIFSNKKPYDDELEKDAKTTQNEEWDERWNSLGGKHTKTKKNKKTKTNKRRRKTNKRRRTRRIRR